MSVGNFIDISTVSFVAIMYCVSAWSGSAVLAELRNKPVFNMVKSARAVCNYVIRIVTSRETPMHKDDAWNVICTLVFFSTFGAGLMVAMHLQYLIDGDYVYRGVTRNAQWMAAHTVLAFTECGLHIGAMIFIHTEDGKSGGLDDK